jgi:hypothetical protein
MLPLSSDLAKTSLGLTAEKSLVIGSATLSLYPLEDRDKFYEAGFMNIVLWDGDRVLGLGVAELENSNIVIKYQEKMKKLNASWIVGISAKDHKVYLQHWDGFRTALDADSFEVIGQEFTK